MKDAHDFHTPDMFAIEIDSTSPNSVVADKQLLNIYNSISHSTALSAQIKGNQPEFTLEPCHQENGKKPKGRGTGDRWRDQGIKGKIGPKKTNR